MHQQNYYILLFDLKEYMGVQELPYLWKGTSANIFYKL